jgi:hypothetical protein
MGFRNVLVLFFSAMAVSMVILIVFFSLFFKNFDNLVTFDTKLPESAPEIGTMTPIDNASGDPSRVQGVSHSTINVPQDSRGGSVNTTDTASSTPTFRDSSVGPGAGIKTPGDLNTASPEEDETISPNETDTEAPPKTSTTAPTVDSSTNKQKKPSESAPERSTERKPLPSRRVGGGSEMAPRTTPKETVPPQPTTPAEDNSPPVPAPEKTGHHQVIMDGFATKIDAQKTLETMKAQGYQAILKESKGKPVIQLGVFSKKEYAEDLAGKTGGRVNNQD